MIDGPEVPAQDPPHMEPDVLKAVPQAALGESILRAIGRSGEYEFKEIYNWVKGDYGSVTERSVHRYLEVFCRRNWVRWTGSTRQRVYSRGSEYVEWWRKEQSSGQAAKATSA